MVNVRDKRCTHEGLSKAPKVGVEGGNAALYCKQHAEDVTLESSTCAVSMTAAAGVDAWCGGQQGDPVL